MNRRCPACKANGLPRLFLVFQRQVACRKCGRQFGQWREWKYLIWGLMPVVIAFSMIALLDPGAWYFWTALAAWVVIVAVDAMIPLREFKL